MTVGAIEPAFFAALLTGLAMDPDEIDQNDLTTWPTLERRFATRFAERSRDDWAKVFAGSDACVTPVLSLAEAPDHPHNRSRATFAEPAGPSQPMPAPRFLRTPAVVAMSHITDPDAILTAWAT